MNYYNEHDPKAAAWLRELIKAGHIPAGEVDERSILDVRAVELSRFTQCHFFAGIGGWSLALRLAGWPDDKPVWTGSCPCQPFSAAGKQMGTADSRHLWPAFRRLILHGAPSVVFGEQVASKLGRDWLVGVRANLETMGYAVGSADLCAAGIGAPHIRQRLFWVADAGHEQARWCARPGETESGRAFGEPSGRGDDGGLADVLKPGLEGHAGHGDDRNEPGRNGAHKIGSTAESGGSGGMGNAKCEGSLSGSHGGIHCSEARRGPRDVEPKRSGDADFWSAYDLIPCADGKARRIEPGTFPLAHGVSGRVGLLRGYGNAIVPQVAAQFIRAYLEAKADLI